MGIHQTNTHTHTRKAAQKVLAITEESWQWTWIMPWVVYKYGCPYEWVYVRSAHPSSALLCSPRTEIIPSLQGSRGHWMVGRSDGKRRAKERRWDLEITARWAGLYRPNGSDEGQLTSLPGDKIQSEGERNEKRLWISRGRDRKTHPLSWTEKEIGKEIKYEKRSII